MYTDLNLNLLYCHYPNSKSSLDNLFPVEYYDRFLACYSRSLNCSSRSILHIPAATISTDHITEAALSFGTHFAEQVVVKRYESEPQNICNIPNPAPG